MVPRNTVILFIAVEGDHVYIVKSTAILVWIIFAVVGYSVPGMYLRTYQV